MKRKSLLEITLEVKLVSDEIQIRQQRHPSNFEEKIFEEKKSETFLKARLIFFSPNFLIFK